MLGKQTLVWVCAWIACCRCSSCTKGLSPRLCLSLLCDRSHGTLLELISGLQLSSLVPVSRQVLCNGSAHDVQRRCRRPSTLIKLELEEEEEATSRAVMAFFILSTSSSVWVVADSLPSRSLVQHNRMSQKPLQEPKTGQSLAGTPLFAHHKQDIPHCTIA